MNFIPNVLAGFRSNHLSVGPILLARSRRFALSAIVGAFGLYVVAHSPLRDVIVALLGLKSRACYFICADALTFHGAADSLSAWALILAAALAAWIVTDWFDGASYERPLVFALSALGFIAVPAAMIGGLASWSGTALLRPPAGPLLSAVPALALVGISLQRGWRPQWPRLPLEPFHGLVLLVTALAAALLLASTTISLMFPPTGYDALAYHAPLAAFLWRDGNLSTFLDRVPVNTLANPGTAQLWYGLLLLAAGERLADLGQLPFALLGGAAVCALTRRLGLGRGAAWLAAGAFLLAPLVVGQTGIQVADVAGASLLMAAVALASAPLRAWTPLRFALVGLGLGLVTTTKLALLPSVAGVTLFVVGATLWHACRQQSIRAVALQLTLLWLLFFAVVAPWWLRNVTRYGNPVYPAGIPLIGHGIFLSTDYPRIDREFVPSSVVWPLYPLIERHSDRSGLGALFGLGVFIGSVIAARRARRQPLYLCGFVVAFALPAWWTLTNHDPRFLLAVFGLGFAFFPWSLLAVPRHQRRVGGGLAAAAAIFSTLVTFEQALLPLARQPMPRFEFYDRVWGVDPLVAALPESEGLLLHTGHANYTYPAYYPLLGPSLSRLVIRVDTEATMDSIVASMRPAGIQYAYVSASPQSRSIVEALYDRSQFELVHMSMVEEGWRSGTRRYLFRLK